MNRYNLNYDEWYDVAAIGLCKAAAAYDPSRGVKFSVCAYFYMFNELQHFNSASHKERLNQRQICAHLENTLNNSDGLKLGDCLSYDDDFSTPEAEEIVSGFTPREKKVLYLSLAGENPKAIQQKIGYGRTTICNIRRGMKQKALAYMEG
jgi:DNA-directed RNA polymerase sigma subunit (sigma70/sigma32)